MPGLTVEVRVGLSRQISVVVLGASLLDLVFSANFLLTAEKNPSVPAQRFPYYVPFAHFLLLVFLNRMKKRAG